MFFISESYKDTHFAYLTQDFAPVTQSPARFVAPLQQKPNTKMDMNNKQVYQAPECEQFELRLEGVIAASGEEPLYNGFDEEFFW